MKMPKYSHLIIGICVGRIPRLAHSQSDSSGTLAIATITADSGFSQSDFSLTSAIATNTADVDFSQSDFSGTPATSTGTADADFPQSDFSGTSAITTSVAGAGYSSIEAAQTHTVAVGKVGVAYVVKYHVCEDCTHGSQDKSNQYDPASLKAAVGDVIGTDVLK